MNGRRRQRRLGRWLFTVVAAIGLAACPSFSRKGEEQAENPRDTSRVGEGLGVDQPTTTGVARGTTPAPALPATPGTAAGRPGGAGGAATSTTARLPANVSSRTDPSGFRLTLAVGGSLRYSATDDIPIQLDVENTSSRPLQYDTNQLAHFVIRPPEGEAGAMWRESDCRPRPVQESPPSPAGTVEPGERITFQAVYPAAPENRERERCRKRGGEYEVVGRLEWCPPGTTDANGACDPSQTKLVQSTPILITIG